MWTLYQLAKCFCQVLNLTDLLASVYEHTIGSEPSSSHEAEADCFNLLQITAKMEKWIPWAEENMVKFSDIQPMY